MNRTARLAVSVVFAAGFALSATALPSAAAQGPSYQGGNCPPGMTCTHWCPGYPTPPGGQVLSWDWNVCHDWYWDSFGITDVTTNIMYPWSGAPRPATPPPLAPVPPPPPPAAPMPFCSPRGSLIIIPPICDEIGVDLPPGSVR